MSLANRKRTVVLIGLEDALARELTERLSEKYPFLHFVLAPTASDCLTLTKPSEIDLVFCAAEANHFLAVLDSIKRTRPDVPVIVASRHPETSQWLDAIEAGASDYCAAPFEPTQMSWILDTHLIGPQTATA